MFTSQSAAAFYDKLFSSLDFTLPRAETGRRGFPKEAMLCSLIVMKCEGFSQVTDLADYLNNNRLIAHYCGFNIMEPLPSYWTYDRFLRQQDNAEIKSVMADLVRQLYELGLVDASFVGLDSTPIMDSTVAVDILAAANLICDAGLAMHKDGKTTDNGRTRRKFCCPFRQSKRGVCPCNHKNWNNGKKNRGCVKYRIIPSDYRLSIDRSCLYFKRTYALRTECERYNSRFKASGQERLWVRNGNSAANLNTLAHISALAVALAAVLSGSHSYRASKSFRRTA